MMPDLYGLPGADVVERGLADLQAGRATPESALLRVATRRLAALGLPIATRASESPHSWAELELYERLRDEADPYGRYCALLAELDSFMDALEARRSRARRRSSPTADQAVDGQTPDT